MIDTIIHGNCLDVLPDIPDASIDAVITDPPYPHIKRDYGYWTEAEWWELMVEGVVPQVRRALKPTGSAVFILQPNSEKVGKMRGWLWRFMYWVTQEWNMVQDVWWWNTTAMPTVHTQRRFGLTRYSLKACVWAGNRKCHRNQDKILLDEAARTQIRNQDKRVRLGRARFNGKSGHSINLDTIDKASSERGGVTPFNCLPIGANSTVGKSGHGAGTPLKLADWWTRYIVPLGGVVLDPFAGVATMALAAIQNGCHYIMIEKEERYCDTARERIATELEKNRQMELNL